MDKLFLVGYFSLIVFLIIQKEERIPTNQQVRVTKQRISSPPHPMIKWQFIEWRLMPSQTAIRMSSRKELMSVVGRTLLSV